MAQTMIIGHNEAADERSTHSEVEQPTPDSDRQIERRASGSSSCWSRWWRGKTTRVQPLEDEKTQKERRNTLSGNRKHSNLIKTMQSGDEGTMEYRLFFEASGKKISPWHDIPLYPAGKPGLLNFVVEIPRGTRAKLEVATTEKGNPIVQDTKKGKLRYYGIDPVFNYGCFPQTWEDPHVTHQDANCVGDGDPVDVVEIGERVLPSGSVVAVKPLGVLCMIDEGEADWKVIAICSDDPKAALLDDIDDVERVLPGKVAEVREWFRTYKTHEGKDLNTFGLDEQAKGRAYTLKVVQQAHEDWANLWMGVTDRGEFEM